MNVHKICWGVFTYLNIPLQSPSIRRPQDVHLVKEKWLRLLQNQTDRQSWTRARWWRVGLQLQRSLPRWPRAARRPDRPQCTPARQDFDHHSKFRITMLVMMLMITIVTMIDLNKSKVKLHLEPAVRSRGVRGLGRHHAGDQRHLDQVKKCHK